MTMLYFENDYWICLNKMCSMLIGILYQPIFLTKQNAWLPRFLKLSFYTCDISHEEIMKSFNSNINHRYCMYIYIYIILLFLFLFFSPEVEPINPGKIIKSQWMTVLAEALWSKLRTQTNQRNSLNKSYLKGNHGTLWLLKCFFYPRQKKQKYHEVKYPNWSKYSSLYILQKELLILHYILIYV